MTDDRTNPVGEKLFDAWLHSALEYDKSLLVVASAGLGLIASLTDKSSHEAVAVKLMLLAATLAFSVVVVSVILTFSANKSFIEAKDGSDHESKIKRRLQLLDKASIGSFVFGISAMALATGLLIFGKENNTVSDHELEKKILEAAVRGELKVSMDSLVNAKYMANQLVGPKAALSTAPAPPSQPAPTASRSSNTGAAGDQKVPSKP